MPFSFADQDVPLLGVVMPLAALEVAVVIAPLLLTVPFSVAPDAVNAVAALVVTVGAIAAVHAGDEATSVSVPRFVAPVTPAMEDVPVWVILPAASGVESVGRT